MKFATILISAALAVNLQRRRPKPELAQLLAAKGPSAADIIDHCDQDGDAMLSKEEVFNCIKKDVPEEHHQEAKDFIDDIWPHIDTDGSGLVDEHELAAAMRGKGRLAQKKGGKKPKGEAPELAQLLAGKGPSASDVIDHCDQDGDAMLSKEEVFNCVKAEVPEEHHQEVKDFIDDIWPHIDTDGSGLVDEHELAAAMRGKGRLAQKKGGKKPKGEAPELAQLLAGRGPSASDIIDHCDKDGDAMLSKEEVFNCIKKDVPEEYHADIQAAIDEIWPHIDTDGSGLVDEHELAAAMRQHGRLAQKKGGKKPKGEAPELAQLLRGKGPSAADIIDHCDQDGDAMLSKEEVFNCVSADVPEEYHDDVKAAIDEIWPHIDTDGSGLVDEHELAAAMRKHGGLAQKKGGKKLAQLLRKGPSASDVIDACDADGSGGISKAEAHACIDAHVPEKYREQAHAAVDEGFDDVDTNGDGEIDEHELAAAMKNHGH